MNPVTAALSPVMKVACIWCTYVCVYACSSTCFSRAHLVVPYRSGLSNESHPARQAGGVGCQKRLAMSRAARAKKLKPKARKKKKPSQGRNQNQTQRLWGAARDEFVQRHRKRKREGVKKNNINNTIHKHRLIMRRVY